jgi:hypothetical protein
LAGEQPVLGLPYQCSGAITRYRFVTLNGDQVVKQADAAGQRALGGNGGTDISATEATNGKTISVRVQGVVLITASAAITRGDRVSATAVGKAKTAIATEVPLGIALKAAAADGDLIPVLLAQGLPAA